MNFWCQKAKHEVRKSSKPDRKTGCRGAEATSSEIILNLWCVCDDLAAWFKQLQFAV